MVHCLWLIEWLRRRQAGSKKRARLRGAGGANQRRENAVQRGRGAESQAVDPHPVPLRQRRQAVSEAGQHHFLRPHRGGSDHPPV